MCSNSSANLTERPTAAARRRRPRTRIYANHVAHGDPNDGLLKSYAKELALRHSKGVMSTFDLSLKQWVDWARPYAVFDDGTMGNLDAFEFGCATSETRPVLCPHALNPYRSIEECTMKLHVVPDGIADYFQVDNDLHSCKFRVNVPRLLPVPPPPAEGVDRPRPRPRIAGFRGFFSREKALDRAKHDEKLCRKMVKAYARAVSHKNKKQTTASANRTPPLLRPWDLTLDPHCHRLVNQHLQFYDSGTGLAIRNFHSTEGVSANVWQRVKNSAVLCPVCSCYYSQDGYFDHLNLDGTCRNWFEPLHPPAIAPEEGIARTSVSREGNVFDRDAPSLAALFEWNSRIGLNRDVWTFVTTIDISCTYCKRVRAPAAHHAHLASCNFHS